MLERFWLPLMFTPDFRLPERRDEGPFLFNAEVELSLLENDQGRKLFLKLFDSQEFVEKIQKLRRILNQPLSLRGVNSLKHSLSGSLFEIICFHFLQEKIAPGEVLLSPQETFDLYHFLYHQKAISRFYGLNLGIEGITVPDGLILSQNHRETIITGICEYTLTTPEFSATKQKQIEHYQNPTQFLGNLLPFGLVFRQKFLESFLHQLHPELPSELSADFGNPQLIYITTQGNKMPELDKARRLTIPLSSQEFGGVCHGIFQDLGLED